MMKNFYLFPLVIIVMMAFTTVSAQPPINNNQSTNLAEPSSQQRGWLGVVLSPVPEALGTHLQSLLPAGQGLMVRHVERDSPAAIAGIQQYDILLQLDDQKLYSPAQLSSLIGSIGPGKNVNLQLIHEASLKSIPVEISVRPASRMSSPPYRYGLPFPAQPRLPHHPPAFNLAPDSASVWDSFESVKVNTLGNGRYHAEVTFKNRDNETRSFVFEGKKNEIIQQIQQLKELPAKHREALLNALNMRTDRFSTPFNTPFFQHNPFNHPFFQHNLFNDPFFQAPLYNRYPSPKRPPYFDRNSYPQYGQPGWLNR